MRKNGNKLGPLGHRSIPFWYGRKKGPCSGRTVKLTGPSWRSGFQMLVLKPEPEVSYFPSVTQALEKFSITNKLCIPNRGGPLPSPSSFLSSSALPPTLPPPPHLRVRVCVHTPLGAAVLSRWSRCREREQVCGSLSSGVDVRTLARP